ncbi:MAG TPA: response regulator [Azospirillum sp.]|nr:response regulator [Azospirillum sp.]
MGRSSSFSGLAGDLWGGPTPPHTMAVPPTVHVLVAESDPLTAHSLGTALAADGYRVSLAFDGAAALAIGRHDPADVLVTALHLAVVDGRTLMRRLRTAAARLPVLVLAGPAGAGAGDDPSGDLADGRPGALRLLQRPVGTADLVAAVRAVRPA